MEPGVRWGSRSPPMGRGNFWDGKGLSLLSIGTLYGHLCKIAEPIEMPFGFWARMGPRNHVLDGPGGPQVLRGTLAW